MSSVFATYFATSKDWKTKTFEELNPLNTKSKHYYYTSQFLWSSIKSKTKYTLHTHAIFSIFLKFTFCDAFFSLIQSSERSCSFIVNIGRLKAPIFRFYYFFFVVMLKIHKYWEFILVTKNISFSFREVYF